MTKRRRAQVAGRVTMARGRALRIADALQEVAVRLADRADVRVGDLVVVRGRLQATRVDDAVLVSRSRHGAPPDDGEFARLARHGTGRRIADRARALAGMRATLDSMGFVEVETPLRARTGALDLHLESVRADGGWLITSPELHMKRLLVGGLPRIYQLARCFRGGELGALHEPEFTMLEWYRAFAGYEDVMADTERIVEAVTTSLNGRPRIKLAQGGSIDVRGPFDRLTIRDAFRLYAGVTDAADLCEEDEDRYFRLLIDRVEPGLTKRRKPVFVEAYPASQASLARLSPRDPRVAERFELYIAGVELCNGFGELTDPAEQRRRFTRDRRERRRRRLKVHATDERFLAALDEGLPAAGGNALGVDRLVALICGAATIAEVQAFPAARL